MSSPRDAGVPIQSAALGNQLLNARNARMKAEHDRELLANRINRLKMEQDRVEKRIDETKRRAKEILELKQRNRVNNDAKNEARQWLDSELGRQKEHLSSLRNERKQAIVLSKEAVTQSKREEVSARKQMRNQNESAVAHFRHIEHQKAINCRGVVREQKRLAQERKSQEREMHLAHLRSQAEDKRDTTERERMLREQEMIKMEKMEMDLIKSLTQCQEEQKQAYEELEATLLGQSNSSALSANATRDRIKIRNGHNAS